jgi:hypothetical protein
MKPVPMTATTQSRASKLQRDRNDALTEMTELCAMFDAGPAPSPAFIANVNLLVAALQRPSGDFAVGLSSVGNPDFGQYGGCGSMSPTCVVYASTIEDVITICRAYIEVFDLGGGNCPEFPVLTRTEQKWRVSYNGRVWQKGRNGKDEEVVTTLKHEASESPITASTP